MPAIFTAEIGDTFDQGSVGGRERFLIPTHIVLKAGAAMSAKLEAPAVDFELMTADAGCGPGRLRHDLSELRDFEFEHITQSRHGVLDAEHELHMKRRGNEALLHQLDRLVEHRQIEYLDLGFDAVVAHFLGELADESR